MPMVCGYCGSQIEIDGEVCHQIGCLAPVPYGDEDAPPVHFHSDACYAPGPGDTEVLVCGFTGPVITAHVCGGKQARICRVTGKEHDMSAVVRFKDGGSVACKDCGVTAMQIDLMELP